MPALMSSGARLREALDELGLQARPFVKIWLGVPAGQTVNRQHPRWREFESHRRKLTRWLADEVQVGDDNARELVDALNRARRRQGLGRLPADYLATDRKTRRQNLGEIEAKLDELLVLVRRLAAAQARNGRGP